MQTSLRNLVYIAVAVVLSAPFTVFLPLIWAPRPFGIPVLLTFIRLHSWLLRLICGLSFSIVGKQFLPSAPYLIASSHQSSWETAFFHTLLDNPAVLAKSELFDLFILGSIMTANGHIPLTRNGGLTEMRASFALAKQRVTDGRNVLIFPSGTRETADTAAIKTGILVLYKLLKCPVVPVVLNSGRFVSRRFPYFSPGHITVRILPAIPVGLANDTFMSRLHNALSLPPV